MVYRVDYKQNRPTPKDMVLFPARIPYLRFLTLLFAIGVFVWLALEGDLTYALTVGISSVVIAWCHLLERLLGGRAWRLWRFLAILVIAGLAGGLTANVAVLAAMSIKTGLHGHGPEFTFQEVRWVIDQLPLWLIIGTLLGLGLGLVLGSTTSVNSRER